MSMAGKIGRWLRVRLPEPDDLDEVRGSALIIGFGRFGQIVSQCLLAESVDVITPFHRVQ
jgi:hypothetical protein